MADRLDLSVIMTRDEDDEQGQPVCHRTKVEALSGALCIKRLSPLHYQGPIISNPRALTSLPVKVLAL